MTTACTREIHDVIAVQVLQVVPVPANAISIPHTATNGRAATLGNQKRKREASDQQDEAAQAHVHASAGPTCEHGGKSDNERVSGSKAGDATAADEPGLPEQAQWGRTHAAELDEVVRWCAPRIAWDILRLQLKVIISPKNGLFSWLQASRKQSYYIEFC